jgi:FkbM family methyltransferase
MKNPLLKLLQGFRSVIGRIERLWFGFTAVMARETRRPGDFYFVQIGANDGLTVDPIREYILQHRWRGILVEPQKKFFAALQRNYAGVPGLHFENVAISDRAENKQLFVPGGDNPDAPEWGGLAATFKPRAHSSGEDLNFAQEEVACVTLESVVRKHGLPRIDLLQVDTEGYDYEIIKSVNFAAMAPRIIHYEHRHVTAEEQFNLKLLLKSHGYAVVEDGYDTVAQRPA